MLNLHHFAKQQASSLTATTCTQPFMPNCDVYKVFNKIYLMALSLDHHPILNLKTTPQESEMLRDIYPFIHTGYYMHKQHWISIYEHEDLSEDLLKDLINTSYQLVISNLIKIQKQQLQILQSIEKSTQ